MGDLVLPQHVSTNLGRSPPCEALTASTMLGRYVLPLTAAEAMIGEIAKKKKEAKKKK